ncbi:MAG: Crp/Fnr family transcriptional regulator [Mediterranea sp.]|jgi:CRP-like cAMP-binding protein|nr:Crp/Fnr family transcriptional regulator [Mediterranea sp.]
MKIDTQLLQTDEKSLFKGFPEARILSELEYAGYTLHCYMPGEYLVRQGEPCRRITILLEGTARSEITDISGRFIELENIAPPRAIGLYTLFAQKHNYYPADIIAQKMANTLEISKEGIETLMERTSMFRQNILTCLSEYLMMWIDKLVFLSCKTIRQKIAYYLLKQQQSQGGQTLEIGCSQQELSEQFGVSRSALAREVSQLEREKLIKRERRQITILNQEQLQAIVWGI